MGDTERHLTVKADAGTHFAWLRTRMALERTLLAAIRTGTALIGFGFTIVQFFQRLSGHGERSDRTLPIRAALSRLGVDRRRCGFTLDLPCHVSQLAGGSLGRGLSGDRRHATPAEDDTGFVGGGDRDPGWHLHFCRSDLSSDLMIAARRSLMEIAWT